MKDSEANGRQNASGRVTDFLARVWDEAFPEIDAATIPIYGIQNDRFKLDRTGVLFRVADKSFILTAAHGLRGILTYKIPLCVDYSKTHELPIPLVEGRYNLPMEENGRDVAAIELPQSLVDDFVPHRRFLTMADVDMETNPKKGIYAALGFPTDWFQTQGEAYPRPLPFIGSIYEGKRKPDTCYDPKIHLVIGFDRKSVNVLTNTKQFLPKLDGMSGCGLWRIVDYSRASMKNWSPRKVRLVGLEHRSVLYEGNRYMQGTWIRHAVGMIYQEYPTLQNAMHLSFPKGYY